MLLKKLVWEIEMDSLNINFKNKFNELFNDYLETCYLF